MDSVDRVKHTKKRRNKKQNIHRISQEICFKTYKMNFEASNIKNFDTLRKVTLWAGGLGVLQSLIWIALTSAGIAAYTCSIDLPAYRNFGTIVQYVFSEVYFCEMFPPYNHTILDTVDRVLDKEQILIWTSVYLVVTACWLLASVLLLTHVSKDKLMVTVAVLYTWVTVTFFISTLDLSLGVIFGIDYGNFHNKAYEFNLDNGQAAEIDPNAVVLIAGQIAAITLMIISLKGFVLWTINVGLMVYLCVKAISIRSYKDDNNTLFMPRKDSDDILATQQPINAYENGKSHANHAFIPDSQSNGMIDLNQEAIARAARMSTDANLQDRRFRNLDNFQQYPPPQSNNINKRAVSPENLTVTAVVTTAPYPVPDYSPPMSRANQPAQNAMQRNQRY